MTGPVQLPRSTVRAPDGRIVAYVLPVEDVRALRGDLESLRDRLVLSDDVRSHCVAELTRMANSLLPQPAGAVEWQPEPEESADRPHLIDAPTPA